mmetsp:Transcript_43258/g.57234  ORF Transcript_43258/g.57234 Transcript_43258/m.57234 type:complete len:83 (-) Transcript_43258:712-960(-)|eukprot:CAMPEP_0170467790 /NCGR_PEP_ID=MMETSP0123-20130129/11237_1 /TAXON_ID=182087 /ORGANISM="Favella ehrenbergii, Strain Fehren 1" /LENGTH=82 /DNA_ID=CAMNT_0010734245 /DNA_START=180 /DNA_END=428 /DNA_ORIENTATION=+
MSIKGKVTIATLGAATLLVFGENVAMWIEAILQILLLATALGAGEAVIIGDCLKHVEPDGALLALEVARLQLDAVERAHCVT